MLGGGEQQDGPAGDLHPVSAPGLGLRAAAQDRAGFHSRRTPALAAPFPEDGPLLINDYKRTVASRIVAANEEVFFEPLPEMLKSVVVLEITVDRRGYPLDVYVIRSNGYPELEQVALASVLRAAPFDGPQPGVLQGAASVSFLETFLFRAG